MASNTTMSDAGEQSTSVPDRRRLRIFLMYILPPMIAVFVVAMPLLSTVSVLPRIRVSPGFSLTDQRGEQLTNVDLRGAIVVFGIVSLDCGETCVTTISAMRDAAARTVERVDDEEAPELRLVAIVVDQEAERSDLARFAANQGIDGERWSVVSGSQSAVRAVVTTGFDVDLRPAADGAPIYEAGVFLSDQAGFLRAEYRSDQPRSATIAADINRIFDEVSAGAVGGLLYDAAHSLSLTCGS